MFKNIKTYFLTGLAASLPIIISIYIIWFVFNFVDRLIFGRLSFLKDIPVLSHFMELINKIPGIGFILTLLLIIFIGAFTKNILGRTILNYFDKIMSSLPLVKSIYISVKQIVDAVFNKQNNSFKDVVLVEYPRKEVYALAFVTNETKGEVQEKTEEDVVSIFLPTTPNPTSGFLLLVPKKDIIYLDMSIEEGIKMIISAGVFNPAYPKIKKETK